MIAIRDRSAVRIITNPSRDERFVKRANELAERARTADELERLLREEYPSARVVTGVTDVIDRWYAYRDGRWTRSEGGR